MNLQRTAEPRLRASEASGFAQVEQAFHALLRSYGRLRQVMDPYFARFGISASQWAILRVLQRAEAAGEGTLRLREVGRRLMIQPPSVTAVVDRLERHGLLERQHVKSDQRARSVALTAAGRKLVAGILKGHRAQIASLFSDHAPEEVRNLAALLQKLDKHLAALAHADAQQGGKAKPAGNGAV